MSAWIIVWITYLSMNLLGMLYQLSRNPRYFKDGVTGSRVGFFLFCLLTFVPFAIYLAVNEDSKEEKKDPVEEPAETNSFLFGKDRLPRVYKAEPLFETSLSVDLELMKQRLAKEIAAPLRRELFRFQLLTLARYGSHGLRFNREEIRRAEREESNYSVQATHDPTRDEIVYKLIERE